MQTQFYYLKFGLTTSVNQGELTQALKSEGDDAIQTSDGLCVGTVKDLAALKTWLAEKGATVQVELIDASKAVTDQATAPDVKAFLNTGK